MKELVFEKIRLTNFKSFRGTHEFKVDLDPGLYFVTGENKDDPQIGANGAGKSTLLADALMWVFFDKTIRDKRPADSVTPWASPKSTVEVSVDAVRAGKSFTMTRTRRPNALLYESDTEKERTIDQAEAERVLGMNEDMFRRTIVLGQFGSLFLDMLPEAQSQMFTDALGLDVWLRAADTAVKDARQRERDVSQAESASSVAKGKLEEAEEAQRRAEASSDSWAGSQAKAIDAQKEVVTEAERRMSRLKAEAPPLPKVGGKAGPSLDSLKDEVDDVGRSLRALQQELANAGADLRVWSGKVDEAKANVTKYQGATEDRVCPECNQSVSAKHVREKLQAAIESAEVAATGYVKAKKKKLTSEEKIKDETTLLEDKTNLVRGMEKEFQVRREWQNKVNLLQAEIERSGDRLTDLEDEKNPHKENVKQIGARIKALTKEYEDAVAKFNDAQQLVEASNYWVAAFRDIRLKRLEEALRELEMTTTRYSEQLGLHDWRITFATERETKSGSTTIGFNVFLYPPGAQEPIRWQSYCGGEVQRWQLAVAFALSEILLARAGLSPNIEVYDEPTRGLSPQGVAALIEQLRERSLEQSKAIWLVDHHALDTGLFDGTLKITRSNGSSTFRWQ